MKTATTATMSEMATSTTTPMATTAIITVTTKAPMTTPVATTAMITDQHWQQRWRRWRRWQQRQRRQRQRRQRQRRQRQRRQRRRQQRQQQRRRCWWQLVAGGKSFIFAFKLELVSKRVSSKFLFEVKFAARWNDALNIYKPICEGFLVAQWAVESPVRIPRFRCLILVVIVIKHFGEEI